MMPTARTAASVNQLSSESPRASAQPDAERRRAPNRWTQARRASFGSVAGQRDSRAPRVNAWVKKFSKTRRAEGQRAATAMVAATATASARAGTVIASATVRAEERRGG